MPPFCAPSPPYLLSEPPPNLDRVPDPPEQHGDDRAEMIALLVTALNEAEAAAGQRINEANPDHEHSLASQAYTSLCYDFPMVSTNALAALASSFRSSPMEIGRPIFPITPRFIMGLRYLVSIEFGKQQQEDAQAPDGEDVDIGVKEFESRSLHLLTLCGVVFLLAPALRLAVAHKDEGSSLDDFLAAFETSLVDPLDQSSVIEDSSIVEVGTEDDTLDIKSISSDDMCSEMDDDDSDWEPLETSTIVSDVIKMAESTSSSKGARAGWFDLMGKVATLTDLLPKEIIKSRAWEEMQLTEHLIQGLTGMRMLEKIETQVDVITTAKLYAELLSDHLLSCWSSPSSASQITLVVTALLKLVETPNEVKQKSLSKIATSSNPKKLWEALILNTLAKLCLKVGEYPVSKISVVKVHRTPRNQSSESKKKDISSPSPKFVRCLWTSIQSSLPFLQMQLNDPVAVADSFSQLESVLWVLCYLVKYAPGNTDIRLLLLEGGIFRIALQLFVKVGSEPQMEALRHFLLLSMASCSALAEYAAEVPSFQAAISTPDLFVERSWTRAHAIVWPLLFRTGCMQPSTSKRPGGDAKNLKFGEAEQVVVGALSKILKAVEVNLLEHDPSAFLRELAWLHWLLLLLEEAAATSMGPTFRLWKRGSPLESAIGQCQVALGSVLVHETDTIASSASCEESAEERTSKLDKSPGPESYICGGDSEIGLEKEEKLERDHEHSSANETELGAIQEKMKELLPSILLKLKQLSTLTKCNRGAKID